MPEPEHAVRTPRPAGSLGALLTVSRPRFWLYLAGPVLVGVAFGASAVPDLLSLEALVLFAYFLVPANLYLYGVNDVFDREVDQENPKKAGRERRYEGRAAVPLAVAASLSLLAPVLLVVPVMAWPWLAAWLLLATAYSAPPLRFKTAPLLDSASNGLYVLPGVAAYVALTGDLPPLAAVAGGWLWSMGMHTFSAIPDVGPDRRAGIRTTATWLGADRAFWYCAVVWALAAVAFALAHPLLAVPVLLYPPLALGVRYSAVPVERAYWWFPAVNTLVGMAFTMGGLWRLVDVPA